MDLKDDPVLTPLLQAGWVWSGIRNAALSAPCAAWGSAEQELKVASDTRPSAGLRRLEHLTGPSGLARALSCLSSRAEMGKWALEGRGGLSALEHAVGRLPSLLQQQEHSVPGTVGKEVEGGLCTV